MNQELNERVLDAVTEAGSRLDDYGQRGALGMARMWMEHGRINREQNPMDKHIHRDNLAEVLVGLIEGHDREDQKAALAYARNVINEPFRDPSMNGQKNQAAILRPGEAAKAAQQATRPDPFAR